MISEHGALQLVRLKSNILPNLPKIAHWQVFNGSYSDIENTNATWFIDPPYQSVPGQYAFGSEELDFKHLGEWSKSRKGQIIVCEGAHADWLPFTNLTVFQSAHTKKFYFEKVFYAHN